jgi:hypothetical protein
MTVSSASSYRPYRRTAVPSMLADLIVVIHFAFVLFVVLGGLLVLRWRRLAYLHLPAAAWGAWIEFTGGICPLTPLENSLRSAAGGIAYEGDFVDHYILPVLYPSALTSNTQIILGCLVLALNGGIYGYLFLRERRERQRSGTGP